MEHKKFLKELSNSSHTYDLMRELEGELDDDSVKVGTYLRDVFRAHLGEISSRQIDDLMEYAIEGGENVWGEKADRALVLRAYADHLIKNPHGFGSKSEYLPGWMPWCTSLVSWGLNTDRDSVYDLLKALPSGRIKKTMEVVLSHRDGHLGPELSDEEVDQAVETIVQLEYGEPWFDPSWLFNLVGEARALEHFKRFVLDRGLVSYYSVLPVIEGVFALCSPEELGEIAKRSDTEDKANLKAAMRHLPKEVKPVFEAHLQEQGDSEDKVALQTHWLLHHCADTKTPISEPLVAAAASGLLDYGSNLNPVLEKLGQEDIDRIFTHLAAHHAAKRWRAEVWELAKSKMSVAVGQACMVRMEAVGGSDYDLSKKEVPTLTAFAATHLEAFLGAYPPKAKRRDLIVQALVESKPLASTAPFLFDLLGDGSATVRDYLAGELANTFAFKDIAKDLAPLLTKGKKNVKVGAAQLLTNYHASSPEDREAIAKVATKALEKSNIDEVNALLTPLTAGATQGSGTKKAGALLLTSVLGFQAGIEAIGDSVKKRLQKGFAPLKDTPAEDFTPAHVDDLLKAYAREDHTEVLLALAESMKHGKSEIHMSALDERYGLVWDRLLHLLMPKDPSLVAWTLAYSLNIVCSYRDKPEAKRAILALIAAALPFTTTKQLAGALSAMVTEEVYAQDDANVVLNALIPEHMELAIAPLSALIAHGKKPQASHAAQFILDHAKPALRLAATQGLTAKKKPNRLLATQVYEALAQPEDTDMLQGLLKEEKNDEVADTLRLAVFAAKESSHTPLDDLDDSPKSLAQICDRLGTLQGTVPDELAKALAAHPLTWNSGTPLPPEAEHGLAVLLSREDAKTRRPVLGHLAKRLSPESKTALLTEFFDPGAADWKLYGAGIFGDDAALGVLGAGIDDVARGPGGFKKAERQLDTLSRSDTHAALYWIDRLASRAKSQGIRSRAQALVQQITQAMGIPKDELGEQLVDAMGFDEQGEMSLEYGEKTLKLVLRQDGVEVHDVNSEKVYTSLPAATKADDAEHIAQRKREVAALKKQVKQLHAEQVYRLERAYLTQRTWSVESFKSLYLSRPLLMTYAKSLLWVTRDPKGQTGQVFRVDESLECVNVQEEAVALDQGATVTLAHPIHMTKQEIAAWQALLSDYEIVAPLEQLDREVFEPTDEEKESNRLERFEDAKVSPGKLRGHLDRYGWDRGPAEDAGNVSYYFREVGESGVVCGMTLNPGINVAYSDWEDEQRVKVYFESKELAYATSWRHHPPLPLATLPGALVSETIRELTGLMQGRDTE